MLFEDQEGHSGGAHAHEQEDISETERTAENLETLLLDAQEELKATKRQRIRDMARHPEQEVIIFDLNPGIGILEVGKRGNASVTIPYEVMLPLCQWELIPVNNTGWEDMTGWAGWW